MGVFFLNTVYMVENKHQRTILKMHNNTLQMSSMTQTINVHSFRSITISAHEKLNFICQAKNYMQT